MSLQMQTKTRETHHSAFLLACLMTTLLWTTSPGTVLAQQEAIAAVGQQEFRHACAVCHALGGKGESVMTPGSSIGPETHAKQLMYPYCID